MKSGVIQATKDTILDMSHPSTGLWSGAWDVREVKQKKLSFFSFAKSSHIVSDARAAPEDSTCNTAHVARQLVLLQH